MLPSPVFTTQQFVIFIIFLQCEKAKNLAAESAHSVLFAILV